MESTWDAIITEERDKVSALSDQELFLSIYAVWK